MDFVDEVNLAVLLAEFVLGIYEDKSHLVGYLAATFEKFVKSESDNLEERIFNNVNKFLAEYK